jgi:predicted transposase/invertase (TIGR01784 family)
MKFVDVTNDIAFRKIFGDENRKLALISFLNAVLDFAEGKRVVDVTILNPYQLPKLSGGKATIVDVKATDQNDNTFIVEMQVAEIKDFDKRVLYYASQSYTNQIERGDLYEKLNPTFFIGILDFEVTKNTSYLSRHKIVDIETGEHVIRNMEFSFIELPKFNKTEKELLSIIDQWTYFLKNAENLELIPENIKDEGLITAFDQANKHNWTKQELEDYNKVFIREADEKGRLELAEKRGIRKVATALKKNGVPIETIIAATGLTKQEIESL